MKALILAGGRGERSQVDYPKVLQELKGKKVIDYVVDNVLNFVEPNDIYVIIGYQKEKIKKHLGPSYHYLIQDKQLGTGHAVIQAQKELVDYQGRLLILYGDTPLFKEQSIRGLLNRHKLKQPALTIFTARVEKPPPYGRVLRGSKGKIKAVVEAEDATVEIREKVKEINIGAYVGESALLFPMLKKTEENRRQKEHFLTDLVEELVKQGHLVESYQTYDTDEIVGINTPEDLELAEFIMKKRSFRPLKEEEENIISFGTGGWRAIIGEGFTFDNVRRLAQAVSNKIVREGKENEGVIVGFDRRFLSDKFATALAEVVAGNNIKVSIFPQSTPTPVVTYATMTTEAYMGLVVTASHNHPKYNGIKIQLEGGYPISDRIARPLTDEANSVEIKDIIKTDFDLGLKAGVIKEKDYTDDYIDRVESQISMKTIRDAKLRILLDPMHGVGQVTLETILTEARCHITTIHERRDPLFGGRSPSPDLSSLGILMAHVKEGNYDLGLAMDGDADRVAVVDAKGNYIDINHILLVLYYYLNKYKKKKGAVVRNVATTHLLDRLAKNLDEECIEVPVGFKHISAAMRRSQAVLGGESSGGLTIRGHIPGKDGVLAASLIVEMLAVSGKGIRSFINQVLEITGNLYQAEKNIPYREEMRASLTDKLEQAKVKKIAGYPVKKTYHPDGTKYLLEDDNWVLVRFSGTEPVLRIYTEASSAQKASNLIQGICDIFDIEVTDL